MRVDIFFDYTCEHSFALNRLLRSDPSAGDQIKWRTLSLKELRRDEESPSVLTDPEASFSVLALTLAHGIKEGHFPGFHNSVFESVHAGGHEMSKDDLFDLAQDAGLSRKAFENQRSSLIERVVADHQEAMEQWGAHGTPTIVFDRETSFYSRFRLDELPNSGGWSVIARFAKARWLLEVKRSN